MKLLCQRFNSNYMKRIYGICVCAILFTSCYQDKFLMEECNGYYFGYCESYRLGGGQVIQIESAMTIVKITEQKVNLYIDSDTFLLPDSIVAMAINQETNHTAGTGNDFVYRYNMTMGSNSIDGIIANDGMRWSYERADTVFRFVGKKY